MTRVDYSIDTEEMLRMIEKDPEAFEEHVSIMTEKMINSAPSEQSKSKLKAMQHRIDFGRVNFKGDVHDYCMNLFEEIRQKLILDLINSASPDTREILKEMQIKIERERHVFQGSDLEFASFILGLTWSSFLRMNDCLEVFRIEKKTSNPFLTVIE